MTSPATDTVQSRIETLVALARLIERVERSTTAPGAEQYRALVAQLRSALAADMPSRARDAVLRASPATSELYENMHYEVSGLSRSPLERAVTAELMTMQVLHRVGKVASRD